MRLFHICNVFLVKLWMGRWRLRGYIPFTNWNLVWRHLDKKAANILDVGCGTGKPMRFLNRHGRFITTGFDGFEPSLEQCRRDNSHNTLVLGNIKSFPFGDKSFDIILCLQVLEHFEKEEGKLLLEQMEQIARKQVIVTTDVGKFVQSQGSTGNPLQEHKYVWSIKELRESGYKVFGIGPFLGWGGETGISRLVPAPFRWFTSTLLQLVVGPVVYFFPRRAASALCVKDVSQ